jgi:hypothetical protein
MPANNLFKRKTNEIKDDPSYFSDNIASNAFDNNNRNV